MTPAPPAPAASETRRRFDVHRLAEVVEKLLRLAEARHAAPAREQS
jgi:hypothetical protein